MDLVIHLILSDALNMSVSPPHCFPSLFSSLCVITSIFRRLRRPKTYFYRGYRTIYPPLTISTFCHFRENCIFGDLKFARNFNVLQFQSARGARRRKNVLQFQRVCNFYISKISGAQQFPCCCNFYIQRSTGCMQFQRITISTRARSAQAKNCPSSVPVQGGNDF